ncbi:DNA/RNA non-specific endonuclease [Lactiplantibacillus modestisalitolerans]|uniref:DNA/RNA non-specific endonuclease n=1 Tax=Lactiplantibacillus modestisalitolerans TaxID=1457219 RepID=A0ABV5WUT3_9LACO|nr:DNA/RNA non-specific endonuclease [Lactiplantibacillus modestisalitolerans]
MKKPMLAGLTLILSLTLSACGQSNETTKSSSTTDEETSAVSTAKSTKASSQKTSSSASQSSTSQASASSAAAPKVTSSQTELLTKLVSLTNNSSAGPTGNYYWQNGYAKFTGATLHAGQYRFTADKQGRPATAKAMLTYGQYEASRGSRQGTPITPDSWPAKNPIVAISYGYTGRTYHGYLYNKSHSIADSLLGKASYESTNNFTTGTRPQNVGADQNGGMRYAESQVERYWQNHPKTDAVVTYQTTPLYHGDETVPRGSVVDFQSSDHTLDMEVVVVNSAEGFKINYDNATNTKTSNGVAASDERSSSASSATSQAASSSQAPSQAQSSTETQAGDLQTDGKWTLAPAGKVFVSDSDRYYTRVTNPQNYALKTQAQAEQDGATRAKRGNGYAQP